MYNYHKELLGVRITRVIYADTLLLVNFSMDFLALYISAKLQNGVVRPIKMTFAAIIGAVWALVSVLLESYVSGFFGQIFMLLANFICAVVIVAVSLGVATPRLRQTVTFITVNIGLGGVMTAIYSFVGKFTNRYGEASSVTGDSVSVAVFIVAAIVAGATSIVYARFKKHYECRKVVEVTISAFGKTFDINALCDSGNLLCEPFSGKPVVVLAAKRMVDKLPQELLNLACDTVDLTVLGGDLAGKVRLIPTSTVTGGGMMLCFTPDSISVEGGSVDAVAAIDAYSEDYEGCDCIIGQTLLNI